MEDRAGGRQPAGPGAPLFILFPFYPLKTILLSQLIGIIEITFQFRLVYHRHHDSQFCILLILNKGVWGPRDTVLYNLFLQFVKFIQYIILLACLFVV